MAATVARVNVVERMGSREMGGLPIRTIGIWRFSVIARNQGTFARFALRRVTVAARSSRKVSPKTLPPRCGCCTIGAPGGQHGGVARI